MKGLSHTQNNSIAVKRYNFYIPQMYSSIDGERGRRDGESNVRRDQPSGFLLP